MLTNNNLEKSINLRCYFYFIYYISIFILLVRRKAMEARIYRAGNYLDLPLEMPRYCCLLKVILKLLTELFSQQFVLKMNQSKIIFNYFEKARLSEICNGMTRVDFKTRLVNHVRHHAALFYYSVTMSTFLNKHAIETHVSFTCIKIKLYFHQIYIGKRFYHIYQRFLK